MAPFTAKVVSTKRIVGPKATGETCHIIMDHGGDMPYWEGQSWGVIAPGKREKDGKPPSWSMMMWQVSPVALGPTIRLVETILAVKGALFLKTLTGTVD